MRRAAAFTALLLGLLLAAAPAQADTEPDTPKSAMKNLVPGGTVPVTRVDAPAAEEAAAPEATAAKADTETPAIRMNSTLAPLRADSGLTKAEGQLAEGKYVQALESAGAVLRRRPTDADALTYAGYALLGIGDAQKAAEYIERALKADPFHLGANTYKAEIYLKSGDTSRALEQMQVIRLACGNFDCPELDRVQSALNKAAGTKN